MMVAKEGITMGIAKEQAVFEGIAESD